MNDKKKSFLLYLDTLEILHKLTDEQAGKLLKAFLAYHSEQDLNLDPMLDLVFFSFQAQFERDLIKYKTIVERNRNNGSKGGRPKNPSKPKEPTGLSGNPSKPKKADSVNDSGSDKDSDSGNKSNTASLDCFSLKAFNKIYGELPAWKNKEKAQSKKKWLTATKGKSDDQIRFMVNGVLNYLEDEEESGKNIDYIKRLPAIINQKIWESYEDIEQ